MAKALHQPNWIRLLCGGSSVHSKGFERSIWSSFEGILQLDDVKLANYIAGLDPGPVEAWRLDQVLTAALQLLSPRPVWLSDWTITKNTFRHPEINFQDYLKLPEILARGLAIRPIKSLTSKRHDRTVEVYYGEESDSKRRAWRTTLKATKSDEVFITTFHHSNWKDLRRVYNRAVRKSLLIRDAEKELARQLSRASKA